MDTYGKIATLLFLSALTNVTLLGDTIPSPTHVNEHIQRGNPKNAVPELLLRNQYRLALQKAIKHVENEKSPESCRFLLQTNREISANMISRVRLRDATRFRVSMSKDEARKLKISLPSDAEVDETMAIFEAQKKALLFLRNYVNSACSDFPNEENFALLQMLREQMTKVANIRGQYLSFNVVSPYLCEATRVAHIAKGYPCWMPDDEIGLERAARIAAKATHKEWLYQVDERCVDQFLNLIVYIKSSLNEEEWRHILTVTSLVPSLDKSKKRGYDCWYDAPEMNYD